MVISHPEIVRFQSIRIPQTFWSKYGQTAMDLLTLAHQSVGRQDHPHHETMLPDGMDCILGACGLHAAPIAVNRRNEFLVKSQGTNSHFSGK